MLSASCTNRNEFYDKKERKRNPHLFAVNNLIFLCLHPFSKVVSLDLYLILTGPHLRAYANTVYTPYLSYTRRMIFKRYCIETLANFTTNLI